MDNMNFVDYILLIIFAVSILVGFRRGLIKELVSLGTLIAAIIIASLFADKLAAVFMNYASVKNFVGYASTSTGMNAAQPVSYLALLLSFCILFALTMIVGSILSQVFGVSLHVGILSLGNHLLGGIFGLVRGFIFVLVLIFAVQLTPLGKMSWWQQSQLVVQYQPYVAQLVAFVSPALAAIEAKTNVGETIKETGQKLQQMIQ